MNELLTLVEIELARAKADADMSTDQEDLVYHNGEIDAYDFVIHLLTKEN